MGLPERLASWTSRLKPAPAREAKPRFKLRIATSNIMNVRALTENHRPDPASRRDRLAHSIVSDLGAPDILALQEVQDNNGPNQDSRVDAKYNLELLIDAIASHGGPRYRYAQIDPEFNHDGGEPNANIRQAFLYNPELVELHPAKHGAFDDQTQIISNSRGVHLSHNPGRIDPANSCFSNARKPLAAEFVDKRSGRSLFLVNVHLTSKLGGSNSELKRAQQARVVDRFLDELHDKLEAAGQEKAYLVTGDFNSEPNEEPVRIIAEGPHRKNIAKGLEDGSYHTYVHQGRKMAIDHMVASIDLSNNGAKALIINTNKPYHLRDSDHNPAVTDILLKKHSIKCSDSPIR